MNSMLIDCHVHIMSPDRMAAGLRWAQKYFSDAGAGADLALTEETALAALTDAGVSYFFNYFYPIFPDTARETNRWNSEFSQREKRAIPFGSFLPTDRELIAIVEEGVHEYCFAGFKFHPYIQKFSIIDPRMFEAYAYLQRLQKPVVFHTGYHEFYGGRPLNKEVELILRSFPDLPVVIAHGFFPYLNDAFRCLDMYPQLYLDLTNILWDLTKDEIQVNLDKIEAHGSRIMFGTDYPLGYNTYKEQFQLLESLPLDQATKLRLSGGTALDLVKQYFN